MTLSLKEEQAVADIASILCDFLPGSGSAVWKGHVNFRSVAEEAGVGRFWPGGSKQNAIATLLRRTLTHERACFERLILSVVRAAMTYRQKQGRPLTTVELDQLNGAILGVGFKFPDLWDPGLRAMLTMDEGARSQAKVDEALQEERVRSTALSKRAAKLDELQGRFTALHAQAERQAAGFALERMLTELFALEGLSPTESFKVIGEQIDGAFELDHEPYLLEAKWEKAPLAEAPLLVFRGKIEGKSSITRGVLISLSGVTAQAQTAIVTGKQPNFFIMNGHDLMMVLGQQVDLVKFLRQRTRLLGQRGLVVVPFGELWTR